MELTLNVLRCPEAAVPESRRSSGGDLTIGRGLECEWMLSDPERVLSKRHCVLEFRGGFWQVRDLSTNGTFLNHATAPIGRDLVASLSDGDRLRLGSYEIEVRISAAASQGFGSPAAPAWGGAPSAGMGRAVPDPFADPFAPPPSSGPSPGFATPPLPTAGVALPDDFDPFGDEPPMPDHRPAASDAFMPPRTVGKAAPIPDDWDLGFDLTPPAAPSTNPPPVLPVAAPPVAPARETPPPVAAPPAAPAWEPPPPPPPAPAAPVAAPPPAADSTDPFAEEGVPSIAIPAPAVVAPVAPAAPAVAPPAAAPAPAAMGPDAALALVLQGAGLPATALAGADPAAALVAAGASLRAAVAGLRALLIARADVKREFRIEQTMLRAAGNNPLKFAATDDAALAALLGPKPMVKAVEETVADLNAHQVASLAATQAAARALLDKLAPAGIEAGDKGGGFLGAKEKRLWEAYKALHTQLLDQFEDDFDSAFGKAFARAYEEASRKDGRR
ncbi:type VI secretion system-associated FHA domain protein TagH [Belnapia sp. T6]|uniref:Type VI secretion system-associated FHA domain protein TagH n=1 Tax=Belnapia mucosa TaxID=2804532 RepID=A0ABS1V5H7_9PROT|nr:type VI secretion system-associated FHA domain protein TagH [Belnapia mucosa]MBL6456924.1 type VI secretion system-associated FHA domain protein TagH [Belnapia mucosa]